MSVNSDQPDPREEVWRPSAASTLSRKGELRETMGFPSGSEARAERRIRVVRQESEGIITFDDYINIPRE